MARKDAAWLMEGGSGKDRDGDYWTFDAELREKYEEEIG